MKARFVHTKPKEHILYESVSKLIIVNSMKWILFTLYVDLHRKFCATKIGDFVFYPAQVELKLILYILLFSPARFSFTLFSIIYQYFESVNGRLHCVRTQFHQPIDCDGKKVSTIFVTCAPCAVRSRYANLLQLDNRRVLLKRQVATDAMINIMKMCNVHWNDHQ